MVADEDDTEFIWDEDALQTASRDELIDHIIELQEQMQRYEAHLLELEGRIDFLLSLHADINEWSRLDDGSDHETAHSEQYEH